MKNAEEEFKEAINSMPSVWETIGRACADTFINVVRTISIIPNAMLGKQGFNTDSSQTSQVNQSTKDSNRQKNPEGVLDIHKIVREVHGQVETLVNLARDGQIMERNESAMKGLLHTKKVLESIEKNRLEKVSKSQMKQKVVNLCRNAIDLSQTLLSTKPRLQDSHEDNEEVNMQADMLLEEAQALLAVSHSVLGNNALPNTSPNLAKQPVHQLTNGGLVQQAFDNYRFRTETAKQMLMDSRRAYEKSCDDVAQKTKEATNLLVEMRELDLKKIDIETIRQTLIKGIRALGELREQWGKLVEFFQMLSNIVKCCLHTSLKTFTQTLGNQSGRGSAIFLVTVFKR